MRTVIFVASLLGVSSAIAVPTAISPFDGCTTVRPAASMTVFKCGLVQALRLTPLPGVDPTAQYLSTLAATLRIDDKVLQESTVVPIAGGLPGIRYRSCEAGGKGSCWEGGWALVTHTPNGERFLACTHPWNQPAQATKCQSLLLALATTAETEPDLTSGPRDPELRGRRLKVPPKCNFTSAGQGGGMIVCPDSRLSWSSGPSTSPSFTEPGARALDQLQQTQGTKNIVQRPCALASLEARCSRGTSPDGGSMSVWGTAESKGEWATAYCTFPSQSGPLALPPVCNEIFTLGEGKGQTLFQQDLVTVCEAPSRLGLLTDRSDGARMKLSAHLADRIKTKEMADVFAGFAGKAPAENAKRLHALASQEGVSDCPLVGYLE